MKKYIFPVIAVIPILICMITILPAPNPKRCAICESIPYHAPALVNLATGEVGELTVYEPHPFKVAELNPYQKVGHSVLSMQRDLMVIAIRPIGKHI